MLESNLMNALKWCGSHLKKTKATSTVRPDIGAILGCNLWNFNLLNRKLERSPRL
jgi:hypothetical protein